MRFRITIDTAERAATPSHDCGLFHMTVDESEVLVKTEAMVKLGFTPSVVMVDEILTETS